MLCVSNEPGFWIGKASLRQWRQLALEQLEEEEEETKHSDCKTNGENSTGAKGNVDTDEVILNLNLRISCSKLARSNLSNLCINFKI